MILKLELSGSRHALSTLMNSIKNGEVDGVSYKFSMWESPCDISNPKSAPSWMKPGNEDPTYLAKKEKKEIIDGTTPIDTV